MRRIVIVSLGVAAASLAACGKKPDAPAAPGNGKPVVETSAPAAAAPVGPVAAPRRKPGLWTQTMSMQKFTQATKICIGPDTDTKMSVWGQATKTPCTKNSFSPKLGGWTFESECDMGEGGKIVSHGDITGDFNNDYTVKVTSTTTGAAMAQANGVHEMTMQAKYEGACPADMKPGDLVMNVPGMKGGMKMNIEKMAGMQP